MKYSVIDISSSGVSMIAADIGAGLSEIVFKDRTSLTLLHYLEDTDLTRRGIEKLTEALCVMKDKCASLGVDRIYLISTGALRAVGNMDEVREAIFSACALPVNVIDGVTEAYCDYISNRVFSSYDSAVLIDIGGASIEVCDLSCDKEEGRRCLDFGLLTLHNKFVKGIQPSEAEAKAIKKFLVRRFDRAALPREGAYKTVVMAGATTLALYDVYAEFCKAAPEEGVRAMQYKKFKKLVKHLVGGAGRSRLLLDAAPERLHSVGLAALVARALVKRFDAQVILVSDRGVKEGYLQLLLEGGIEGEWFSFSATPPAEEPSVSAAAEPAQDAAPKKRGRSAKESAQGAAPKKRGRPAKESAQGAAPKKRGRPAKETAQGAAPKKRGRPPKAKQAEEKLS